MYYNALMEEFFHSLGIPLVGFADLSHINEDARRGFRYGISIALPHYKDTIKKILEGSSLEAFNAVNARNKEIKEIAAKGEEFIVAKGFRAFSQAYIKRDEKYETPLPHKTVATAAGMGFIGKSSALITKKYGPAVRLSSILTDMPFETAQPIIKSHCGNCRRCVDACPAGALLDHNWSIASARTDIIDIGSCNGEISRRGKVYNTTGGAICGVCIAACRYSQNYLTEIR